MKLQNIIPMENNSYNIIPVTYTLPIGKALIAYEGKTDMNIYSEKLLTKSAIRELLSKLQPN